MKLDADMKKFITPAVIGLVAGLVLCYFMSGLNINSSFHMGDKKK